MTRVGKSASAESSFEARIEAGQRVTIEHELSRLAADDFNPPIGSAEVLAFPRAETGGGAAQSKAAKTTPASESEG